MTPAEDLLLAAKRCEIDDLLHLATICELVGDISHFIHVLQKERGASNIYLASRGERFADRRREHVQDCRAMEQAMRQRLDILGKSGGRLATSARLLSRIAHVWHGLDRLDELRREIETLQIPTDEATVLFNRLISGLLSVVFDAADTARDPDITLALVAIFHLMQGKELAGQERACGAAGFTATGFDEAHRQLLQQLIEAQQRCFDTFLEFATPQARQHWEQEMPSRTLAGIHQLREMACRSDPLTEPASSLGETWYELATRRIDAIKEVEDYLNRELATLCQEKVIATRDAIANPANLYAELATGTPSSACQQLVELFDGNASQELGELTAQIMDSPLNRSLIDLMRAQAGRLQGISDDLESTRKALRKRKLVERAKGLIMASQQMTEEEAYRFLRKSSMDQGKSMSELATTILGLSDILQKQP
ncbi:nitrate regulatory protein [Halomonas sp. BC04]|uniref:nitrate regulatory protein n=1 Tax=Halomonas sp. BC04 TaxID=1403540 RepID=UPI0003ED6554|nr:nitrate regulatory protein [Halomonas sp. BC04]EWH02261.1 response regulator receiver [Halomonas sp. BC04]